MWNILSHPFWRDNTIDVFIAASSDSLACRSWDLVSKKGNAKLYLVKVVVLITTTPVEGKWFSTACQDLCTVDTLHVSALES